LAFGFFYFSLLKKGVNIMAKQNYIKLAVVIVLTMASSSVVYAAGTLVTGGSIGGSSFNPSNNVKCYFASDGTASTFTGSNYGIACGHEKGDKVVATKSGDSRLYAGTAASNGATAVASTITTGSDLTASGWASM
jgi:hypothetical protein